MPAQPTTVVFDLGGVLVDWNPDYLYRKMMPEAAERAAFLADICSPSWNVSVDQGRPVAEATADLVQRHPDHADFIRAYFDRWLEMVAGPLHETVALVESLAARGVPLYALSNWSAETFPLVRNQEAFGFFNHFHEIFISGDLGLVKPDQAIFVHMLTKTGRRAEECLFVDDNEANVLAAGALGFAAHHFKDAQSLRQDLDRYGLLG